MSDWLPYGRVALVESGSVFLEPLDNRIKQVANLGIIDTPLICRKTLRSVYALIPLPYLLTTIEVPYQPHPSSVLPDLYYALESDVCHQ